MVQNRTDRRRLLTALAGRQAGYFTSEQASELGFSSRLQHHHSKVQNWRRVERGLYRLAEWPLDPEDSFVFASLWSRKLGVISHDSALALYEMSDLMPNEVHLTVPRSFRKRLVPGIRLHRAALKPVEVIDQGLFRTTTPIRTLMDAACSSLSPEHLASAVGEAFRRGLTSKPKIEDAALDLPGPAAVRLRSAIKKAEGAR